MHKLSIHKKKTEWVYAKNCRVFSLSWGGLLKITLLIFRYNCLYVGDRERYITIQQKHYLQSIHTKWFCKTGIFSLARFTQSMLLEPIHQLHHLISKAPFLNAISWIFTWPYRIMFYIYLFFCFCKLNVFLYNNLPNIMHN